MGKGDILKEGTLWQRNCSIAINDSVSNTAYAASWDGVTDAAPSKDAVYDKIEALIAALASVPTLASSTYSPTFTSVANLDSTPTKGGDFSYMRIGSFVQVSGYATVDATVLATITQFGISLPVASNLGAVSDLTGVCAANAVISESGGVFADTTNDRANVHFICNSVSSHALFIQFQYKII